MKSNAQGWVLFALSLPAVIVGYLWLFILCITSVAEWKSLRFQGAGVLTARTRAKLVKFWGFSTTVGRAVLYHPDAYDETPIIDNRTESHEFVHIKQWEDACTWGFMGGALTAGVAAGIASMSGWEFLAAWMAIWCFSVAHPLTNYLTAVLRYGWKGIYRDTEHERSAYAQTDLVRGVGNGKSWDELRDEHRAWQKDLIG